MTQTLKPIYTIGHRNPDTDSICSAIAYAHLKQALGENVLPARAGKLNAETKYVLDLFNVPAPKLISDLHPRVKDIMSQNDIVISPGDTLRDLGTVMKQYNAKSVPVVDKATMALTGIVTLGDLAQLYFEELEMQDLSKAGVDYASIVRVLNGAVVFGENLQQKVTGKVRIAAGSTDYIEQIIDIGDVVLVGNRVNAQLCCLNKGISCLIVTGNGNIQDEVVKLAAVYNSIIIKASYDTYTCARLINQSVPVSMIMKNNVVTFKPNDLVSDIKNIIANTNYRNYPVVDDGKLVGMVNRDQLIVPEKEKVILVDHNERTQAVEGIEEAHIVEIIDHHRLGGLETGEPIFIRHDPVGSTATIVANMHWHRGVEIPANIAGLLLAAIVSDTVLFKSPTSTVVDKRTAEKLAGIANVVLDEFGMAVLKAGSSFVDMKPADIIKYDLKEFQIGEYHVAIGQISVMDTAEMVEMTAKLVEEMEALRLREDFDLVIMMVTDIIKEGTYLIYAGQPKALLSEAFGAISDSVSLYLPGVMSRKKQVVPPLVAAVKS